LPVTSEVRAARREDFLGGSWVGDWYVGVVEELDEYAREAIEEIDIRWIDFERRFRGEPCCSRLRGCGDEDGVVVEARVSSSTEFRAIVGDEVELLEVEGETMVII